MVVGVTPHTLSNNQATRLVLAHNKTMCITKKTTTTTTTMAGHFDNLVLDTMGTNKKKNNDHFLNVNMFKVNE